MQEKQGQLRFPHCPHAFAGLDAQLYFHDPNEKVRNQAWDSAQAEPRGTLYIKL